MKNLVSSKSDWQLHPQPSWQPWQRPVSWQGADDRGVTLPWEDVAWMTCESLFKFPTNLPFLCVICIDKTVLCLIGGGGSSPSYFPKTEDWLVQTKIVQALKVSSTHFHFLKCNSDYQTQFKTTKGIFFSDTKRSKPVFKEMCRGNPFRFWMIHWDLIRRTFLKTVLMNSGHSHLCFG